MSSEDRSFMNLIYHAGADWQVKCSTYADATPILCLDGGPVSVMISTTSRTATEQGVAFARALVKQRSATPPRWSDCTPSSPAPPPTPRRPEASHGRGGWSSHLRPPPFLS